MDIMTEEQRVTRVVNEYREPVEVSLVRGAKGQYRWNISVKAESPLAALRMIQDVDQELRHRYEVEPANSSTQESTPGSQNR
jgi:CTP synthase (UTP-ammonia lyase)